MRPSSIYQQIINRILIGWTAGKYFQFMPTSLCYILLWYQESLFYHPFSIRLHELPNNGAILEFFMTLRLNRTGLRVYHKVPFDLMLYIYLGIIKV